MSKSKFILVALSMLLILAIVAFPLAVNAKPKPPSPPLPAGSTGLTAAVVATSGQKISDKKIDATGCDIGIYIGPGINNVKVLDSTITGANEEGILVQDASNIEITDNNISNNGIRSFYTVPGDPTKQLINEGKAIELVGTTNCIVKDNKVQNNNGDGGIGLTDDGPVNPALPFTGGPNTAVSANFSSTGNFITGNFVKDNAFGCGIVMSAWNPGAGLADNTVFDNTLIGGVGGIIVAADLPSTTATDNLVLDNSVTGSQIMGIIVHSNAPGDVVSGTKVIGNKVSKDGNEGPPFDPTSPTGIAVVAEVPGLAVLTNTQILSNTISNETNGVWTYNDTVTFIADNSQFKVTNPKVINGVPVP